MYQMVLHAVGKITLPSTILQFFDLGGQTGIRNIWHRYYDDCHAVVYIIDAADRERLGEGWEVFGMHVPLLPPPSYPRELTFEITKLKTKTKKSHALTPTRLCTILT